jgi:hypothetical protein
MIKKGIVFLIIGILIWTFLGPKPKAHWSGELVSEDPIQTSENLPASWVYKGFTFTPRATYHIRAVVLSKHSYWAGEEEDKIAPYDLALGWGVMSRADVVNTLKFSQNGRWYNYRWKNAPPIEMGQIIVHSSNNHIISADNHIHKVIKAIKQFDLINLQGYLVDVSEPNGWSWHTSLTRDDNAGGACEVFWVNSAERTSQP